LVRDGVALFVPAALIASPWYIKNALWTGNPVYPFYEEVFRHGLSEGLERSTAVLHSVPIGDGPQRTLLDYLLLPMNLMLDSQRFTGNHTPTAFAPMLVLLPLGILVGWPRAARPAAALTALLLALWAVGPQETRYVLPGAMLLCALMAVALARLLARYERAPLLRGAVQATVLILALLTVHHQLSSGFGGWSRGAVLHLVGLQSRDRYLEEASWLYGGMRYLRQRLPPDATVLYLGDSGGYYAPVRYIQDDALAPLWLLPLENGYAYPVAHGSTAGPVLTGEWTPAHAPSAAAALDALRQQDVRYLFLSYIYAEGLTTDALKEARRKRADELRTLWESGSLELAYADMYCAVLRITDFRGTKSAPR
ncbi:MAG: hypothetical protein NTZ05_13520, partial [Chloroflexi bacterium]|nr:hypothetical protein [Chloroflexota bacterium]